MHRYKVRLHESGERDGSISDGTIVLHLGGGSTIEASSIDDAESQLRAQVANGRLYRGRVYQICPPLGVVEPQRTLAVNLSGEWAACRLENADRLYAGFKRIRLPETGAADHYTAKYASECSSHRREAVPNLI